MQPLAGVKVVDMTAFLAAPTTPRIMGEWGADVIKVEPPRGDPGRTQGTVFGTPCTDDENPGFDMANMNKRFVTVDLRQPRGREVMDRLLADADVFVTSTRVRSLAKLGYDYDTLRERFPRLVMAQVLGFGENGPLKDAAGFDMTTYMSRAGVLATTRDSSSRPMLPPSGYGDFQVSFVLLAGVLAALHQREQTGHGDYVTANLFHSGVFMLNQAMVAAQYGATYPKNRREVINPFNNTYLGSDSGLMALCAPEYDRDFDKVMRLIGRDDLVGDPVLGVCTAVNETGRNGEVVDILDEAFATRPAEHWLALFGEHDVPMAKCQLPQDVYSDPQAIANDVLRTLTYPNGAERMLPTNPVRFRGQGDPALRLSRPQGADTPEVLAELGYDAADIAALLAEGAVHAAARD
ncbi:CaiB/BaiF CoA transferase family protein [Cellulomonas chengniuliangii]|uniref:CoA transferase n=1 Tax=Cellulomonas chengniuliangii TaxID=2968084 RepID=A0ABY5L481_9CELL|nr:CoA transferase [Cellulomonas chengniuliangii]MCC2308470.1 CoA transferase [Cellulomonas chengniuliangii]MCC2317487.1 CoA transferase [Cellulomonas chengniuliangii]UUI76843.1 CoA transferase [Cellulomonas chengniuliangii]